MIILEGPDGAGKSTLAERILNHREGEIESRPDLSFPDRSPDALSKTVKERTYEAINYEIGRMSSGQGNPRLYDRLFFSELVYSRVFGRDCQFTPNQSRYITSMIGLNAMVIWCFPPAQLMVDNINRTPQHEGIVTRLQSIVYGYSEMIRLTPARWRFVYNYADGLDWQRLVPCIESYLDERARSANVSQ